MIIPRIKAVVRIDSPYKVVGVYALVGTAWILGSGLWVAHVIGEVGLGWVLELFKGLFFIAITTVLLFFLIGKLDAKHRAYEAALKDSQLRWQFALEGAGDGLWDWNTETNRVYFSRQWKAILGYAETEIGDSLDDWERLVHPDDLARVKAEIARHWQGETVIYTCEHRLRAKDGAYKWVLDRGQVMQRAPDGTPLRMLGMQSDITQRKTTEALSADALSLARIVLHSSPVGVIAYQADGQAVMANRAAAQIVGTNTAGLLRQNYLQLESWERHGLRAAAQRALREGQTVAQDGPIVTTFGRSIWARMQFVPFTYKEERHLLFLISDETQGHQAQEDLRLMETAVRAAPVGWVVTDPDGRIEWVNPGFTTLTGYTAAEVVGQNPRLLKSGRHGRDFYQTMWAAIKRGEVWSGEMYNQRKDGGQYQERMTIAPVRNEAGAIAHYVAIKQDVTGEKQLEQQLARAQRLESIGMLASGIAHDLNNIFAPIMLSMELLKLKYPASDGHKTLELVENAGRRGAGIVRQLLTFARGIEGERTEVQVKYVIKEAAQMLGETLPRSIEVQSHVAPDLPPVLGDATQLHQVLLNLAINARDAMPEGGVLRFGAKREMLDEVRAARNLPLKPGPCVALTVSDTGTGISPEVLEHMFDPFFTTKALGKGTGLGLSTVYGIVRGHGGAVEVSTQAGQGTTFTVLLPALDRPAGTGGSHPAVVAAFSGAGRRVLVVDDEEPIRLITLHALQRYGFLVEVAMDGIEALALFRKNPARFSALITDLMMPRMNGRELVQEIRRLAPALPVIASSGLSEDNSGTDTAEGLAAQGVRIILRKPYTEAELLAALRQELEPGATSAKNPRAP